MIEVTVTIDLLDLEEETARVLHNELELAVMPHILESMNASVPGTAYHERCVDALNRMRALYNLLNEHFHPESNA